MDPYVCGWDGSSPKDTESPGMSLKHLMQNVYLSENKAGVGFLHIFCGFVWIVYKHWRVLDQGGERKKKKNKKLK